MEHSVLELINRRERQLLVHSFLYYQLDTNVISDHLFDKWCEDLLKLMKEYPELFKQSVEYEGFKDFDGSGGSSLPYMQPWVQRVGYSLLDYKLKH